MDNNDSKALFFGDEQSNVVLPYLLDPYRSKLAIKAAELGFRPYVIQRVFLLFPNGMPESETEFFDNLINYALELEIKNGLATMNAADENCHDEPFSTDVLPQARYMHTKLTNSDRSMRDIESNFGELNLDSLVKEQASRTHTSESLQLSSYATKTFPAANVSPQRSPNTTVNLRPVVIDGDNVAFDP
jgi:hypothetical protein